MISFLLKIVLLSFFPIIFNITFSSEIVNNHFPRAVLCSFPFRVLFPAFQLHANCVFLTFLFSLPTYYPLRVEESSRAAATVYNRIHYHRMTLNENGTSTSVLLYGVTASLRMCFAIVLLPKNTTRTLDVSNIHARIPV